MADIPRLETNRLILRAPLYQDWPDYAEMMASKRACFIGGPVGQGRAWGMFCSEVAMWQLFSFGSLMIEEKSSGNCLGLVGVNEGPFYSEHELGWLLYERAEGKGYAFEAAVRLRDWAFNEMKLTTLVSYIDPNNLRSRRLAEKMGASIDPEAKGFDAKDLVYRHPSAC